jgi:hypothetical protein
LVEVTVLEFSDIGEWLLIDVLVANINGEAGAA